MTNPQKIKGSQFERQAVEVLELLIEDAEAKRIPGSGALGTTLLEPLLTSDVTMKVPSIPKKFKIECKVGYNTSKTDGVKQFTLKKEWLDKVIAEAKASFSIPMLMGKFLGAREGTKIFVVMDVEDFAAVINHITTLQKEIDSSNAGEDI